VAKDQRRNTLNLRAPGANPTSSSIGHVRRTHSNRESRFGGHRLVATDSRSTIATSIPASSRDGANDLGRRQAPRAREVPPTRPERRRAPRRAMRRARLSRLPPPTRRRARDTTSAVTPRNKAERHTFGSLRDIEEKKDGPSAAALNTETPTGETGSVPQKTEAGSRPRADRGTRGAGRQECAASAVRSHPVDGCDESYFPGEPQSAGVTLRRSCGCLTETRPNGPARALSSRYR